MDERGMHGTGPLVALFIILALLGCAQAVPGQGQTAYAPYSDDNGLRVRGGMDGGGGGGGGGSGGM